MKLYESIVNNLKEAETIGDLLEEIDNAYDIGTIESIGKRFKNEMDRKTIEDEVNAIEEEYGDVYSMDEDSDEYASILDELKSCIASDFSGEEENMNETDEIKEGTLEPQYSTRKSFYGKANVNDNDNTLVSYGTPIMKINDGKIEMLCRPEHLTQTTIRHIREFMQQNGMDPVPKNKLVKMIEEQGNIKETEETKKYVYHNAESEDKSTAESMLDNYSKEYPDLQFRISSDSNGMYYVDFIGSYQEISNALINLGYYNEEEINAMMNDNLIKPINEAEDLNTDKFTVCVGSAYSPIECEEYNSLGDAITAIKAKIKELPDEMELNLLDSNKSTILRYVKQNENNASYSGNNEVLKQVLHESVTINGVNYYRVLDESGEEYYSIDPESITTNIIETEEPAKQNKIPRNWKKIYGEMVGQSSAGKAGDKFEITKDEYDRPIMKYEDGKEYQANWSMIRSPEMVKITNVELNESEDLKESSNIIWSSEITEDNFDDATIKENYDDYVANFDTTFKPMSYEEFLDSDWLYNFLEGDFEHQEDYKEWYDYINNFPEDELKKYYQEYLDENKDTKEEPISYESYKEDYINDNSGDEWDYLQEDFLENICPMIDKQVNNDILIVSGDYHSNYPDFRPSGAGGKLLNKAEDILDWLSGEDKVYLVNNGDVIGLEARDHDGGISGNLYTLPDDKELLYEIAKKTDYYDEDRAMEDVLGEFSYDLNHGNIDMSDLRDYADKFVPIKLEW